MDVHIPITNIHLVERMMSEVSFFKPSKNYHMLLTIKPRKFTGLYSCDKHKQYYTVFIVCILKFI